MIELILYMRENLFNYSKRFDEEINNILFYITDGDKYEEKLKNILNGILYINYNPKSEILEKIVNPMSGYFLLAQNMTKDLHME